MESTFFYGACTPRGFVSHYDSLLQEVRQLTIIKGGSGCGKSTFMRAIGRAAQERGLDAVYILCSSDPDSLDGIILPQLSTAYVDGTAPHVLEPGLCGGGMNYLNFGELYDREAMKPNEDEIRAVQAENAAQYPYVTACLAAADKLLDAVREATKHRRYQEETAAIAECLALSSLSAAGDQGSISRRFLSAVTPKGLFFCTKTPAALCQRVYVLRDNYGLAPQLLDLLLQKAEDMGHRCIACYSPLLPDSQPTHLLIPTAKAAFVSESRDFPYSEPCFCRIDLDSTLPPSLRRGLSFYDKTVSTLLYQAVAHLRQAKQLHDRMELLCRPFVDFKAADALTQQTILKLFGEK